MYNGNAAYALTAEQLADVMGMNTLQTLIKRNRAIRVQRGGRGQVALYDVTALPERWRLEVYERFPQTKPCTTPVPLMDGVQPSADALIWFQQFTMPSGKHLTGEMIAELANNAAILEQCTRVIEEVTAVRARSGKRTSKKELWRMMASSLEYLAERGWKNSLPQSGDRLQKKWKEYRTEGPAALLSGKLGNQSASVILPGSPQESLLIKFGADGRNLQDTQVCSAYNDVAKQLGWKTISPGTVANWRQRNNMITEVGRHGKSYMANTKLMQVKRSRPTEPLMLWSADGWDVELFYKKRVNGTMTYSNRLTVVVILDAYCNYPIGYAIDRHENSNVIREALADAMRHTRELFGTMLMVDEYQSDHYAMKALKPYYAMVADKVIPAKVGNAKSKPVERYFLHLNNDICHALPNWSGFGITSRKASQPNLDQLEMIKKDFPDEAGCIAQIEAIINAERAAKRAMMLAKGTPRRRTMDPELFLLNFGQTTGFKNSIEGCGLRVTIGRELRNYDSFDPTWREHDDVRWTVHYDPADLSHVLVTNDDASLRYVLEEKYVQPMALADRKPGDAEQLERVRDFNRRLVADAEARKFEHLEVADNLLLGAGIDPKLSQMIITDGRGQHKDRRNALRAAAESEEIRNKSEELADADTETLFDIY